ncbi:uncharacterized protein KGF55_002456 [Candida pseudojiufengensis]|uniref:uncharacterized protein n=1 Tax=Candida pseudojiufengensis TaxID=497109 RepID=UPI002224A2DF|nr:uncharacterized protein KGF55_002456 [Candida pseudojiufengensis]KAI5963576.1 hypothetical protein KGF55_002456 [Candida pseudojiufengensis]
MDQLKSQFPTTAEDIHYYIELIKSKVPTNLNEIQSHFHQHFQNLQNSNYDTIIDDFKNLRINPITITLTLISLTTLFVFGKIIGSSNTSTSTKSTSSNSTKSEEKGVKSTKKPKKRVSKAQKANKEIQEILDYVESEYVPEIDNYIENYKKLSTDDIETKFKYFDEMLLKELMKLDSIDVTGNEILRENRRKVIKFIQDHQNRLDRFKKDITVKANTTAN